MDGGSSDETVDILKDYGNRLTWVSEADRGQASAINKGWRGGRGAIVAYLNSDDTYLPGAVERAVSELSAHPEAGAVYGEGYHVDEVGRVLRRYPTEPFDLARLAETCFICQPTVFVRREVVERVGYLDEALQFCMDYDLWIRVGRVTTFARVSDFLATTRLHADTKTLGHRVQAHAEILRTVRQHFQIRAPKLGVCIRACCTRLSPPREIGARSVLHAQTDGREWHHLPPVQPGCPIQRVPSVGAVAPTRLAAVARASMNPASLASRPRRSASACRSA